VRYVCADAGCLRAGLTVAESTCAACGAPTLVRQEGRRRVRAGPSVRKSRPAATAPRDWRMPQVVLVTFLASLLGMSSGLFLPLGLVGAVPARRASRRASAEGRPTPAYWIAFWVTLVVTPVVGIAAFWVFFIATGVMGLHH
jgi:hypothetical protein